MKNLQARVAILVIMAIPLLLIAYFYLFTEPVYETIPYQYTVEEDGDTLFHELPPFSLVNQYGDTIGLEDVKGKILFVDFFSVKKNDDDVQIISGNKEIPLRTVLHGNLARIHEKIDWEKEPEILFLSINTGDLSEEVDAYVESYQWPENDWWVLRGNLEDVYRIGRDAFKLEEFEGKTPESAPFTVNYVSLLDKEVKVRGYYIATDLQQERELLQDYVALLRFDYPEETKAVRER